MRRCCSRSCAADARVTHQPAPTQRRPRCSCDLNVGQYLGARAAYIALSCPNASAKSGSVPVSAASRLIRAAGCSPQSLRRAAFATSSSRGPEIPTGSITAIAPWCSRMFAGWRSPCNATAGRPCPCLSSSRPSACSEGTCETAALMLARQSPSPCRPALVGRCSAPRSSANRAGGSRDGRPGRARSKSSAPGR